MDFLSRYVSFEKPMGETLTRILFYLGVAGVIWTAIKMIWFYITKIDNNWDWALWGIIKTPFIALVSLLVLRVVAEYVLAHFRMDKSLHDQVTGRAAPSKAD